MKEITLQSPNIAVVVTARESFYHTKTSLESLLATVPHARLVYVDGGSPPWIASYLKRRSREVPFDLVRVDRFLHPNEARNIGLQRIGASEYVIFAENDIIFAPGWYERLAACAEETGAAVVGPLICIGDPPFETIHYISGELGIEETSSGRQLLTTYHHAGVPLARAPKLQREACNMVELHCVLIRTDLLAALGSFDERLQSVNEHVDFSLNARATGATIVVEPSAMVNQFLPRQMPGGWFDVPFFLSRWSEKSICASLEHFRSKWALRSDDLQLISDYAWARKRWKHMFAPLVAPYTQRLRPWIRSLGGRSRRSERPTPTGGR